MIAFIHILSQVGFVSLTLYFWDQLPLTVEETRDERRRRLVDWTFKGVVVPLLLCFLLNAGLVRWIPPFLPQVELARDAGLSPLAASLRGTISATTVITSYWAAFSLGLLAWTIRLRAEERADFNGSLVVWSVAMLPVAAIILWAGGWAALGVAMLTWLIPLVHATLSTTRAVKRAPSYSQAIAKIKFGKYSEAEWEVIKELEQCENDFDGWMMLAELYAVHFKDFPQAEQTIIDLCEQPGITPSQASVALHRLADWCLRLQNDPVGARKCMEAISKRYPRTHLDRMAKLRRNRIPESREEWTEQTRNKTLHLPALNDDLDEPIELVETNTEDVRQRAENLAERLQRNPDNTHAREEFARALAHLDKLSAAMDQMDLLLGMPDQPENRRAEWAGLKTAWFLKQSPGDPEGRDMLLRIIRDFPDSPQALAATRRIQRMDEQARVAKYAKPANKPRIVIRLDEPAQ